VKQYPAASVSAILINEKSAITDPFPLKSQQKQHYPHKEYPSEKEFPARHKDSPLSSLRVLPDKKTFYPASKSIKYPDFNSCHPVT
jgi:hypothetical protein